MRAFYTSKRKKYYIDINYIICYIFYRYIKLDLISFKVFIYK